MVQIKWLPEAKFDLKEIHDYIALDSKKYAEIQVRKIKQRTDVLKMQPEIGKLVEEINNPKVREIIIGNYRIIYRNVSSKSIDILMIHHGARDMYRRLAK